MNKQKNHYLRLLFKAHLVWFLILLSLLVPVFIFELIKMARGTSLILNTYMFSRIFGAGGYFHFGALITSLVSLFFILRKYLWKNASIQKTIEFKIFHLILTLIFFTFGLGGGLVGPLLINFSLTLSNEESDQYHSPAILPYWQ